ncbi:MAG: hypothetical protein J5985_05150, partial [Kiritimatiellae bacterium]|nr:hypothetical protein [Kiritimatiellia bacterium]
MTAEMRKSAQNRVERGCRRNAVSPCVSFGYDALPPPLHGLIVSGTRLVRVCGEFLRDVRREKTDANGVPSLVSRLLPKSFNTNVTRKATTMKHTHIASIVFAAVAA